MAKNSSDTVDTQRVEHGFLQLVRSDIDRVGSLKLSLVRLGFYAALFYRLSHYFSLKKRFWLACFLQFFSQIFTGAEISHKAMIGPGLYILHPIGVHFGPQITIGRRATICECSSIIYMDGDIPPVIGDFLWLGPGGRIIGNVTLGDHVRVGPNSVVMNDVPSHKTALGIPARPLPKITQEKH